MDNTVLDQKLIADILPQAYPFVMIDKIIDFKRDESLVAIKNITGNEWMFEGQTHKTNVFPETLIIEAASQAALTLYQLSRNVGNAKKIKFILGEVNAEFIRVVKIGEQLKIMVSASKMMEKFGYMNIGLYSENEEVSKVHIKYSVLNEK